ncbi:MAG: DMT family protein [Flavobacteriales bacterium]|nr:MAG: DMT family protein [Flavobacteriales bacterium]
MLEHPGKFTGAINSRAFNHARHPAIAMEPVKRPSQRAHRRMKALSTIGLLILSNAFMTLAWYGHLRFKEYDWGRGLGLFAIIAISWGIAFFEYLLQVPANRIGSNLHGGPFTLVQLKVLQEVITLAVFTLFTLVAFRHETLRWNHALAGLFLVAAVWLVFKK